MTRDEFAIATKTLEEFYDKSLNYTQASIWFDELKYYNKERYENAIKFLCKSNQYKPTLSQVLEAMQHAHYDDNTEQTEVECKACNGTGYIIYHKKENDVDYEYACLCNCENARGKGYDGSKIADREHRSKYYIKNAEEVFCK